MLQEPGKRKLQGWGSLLLSNGTEQDQILKKKLIQREQMKGSNKGRPNLMK